MSSKLSNQMIKGITENFYSHFCGINLSVQKHGIYFVASAERDKILMGQGCKYTAYILVKDDLCAVSYSPKYKNYFEFMKGSRADKIISQISERFNLKKMKLMIFEKEKIADYGNAKILCDSDYPLYEIFFRAAYPNANPTGWLYDYFIEKTEKGYFTGYFLDNRLTSVCDAPDMPYMQDKIQHTGINTLEEERRKGYAKCTVALAAHHLIEIGVCPQYECDAENTASLELSKSVGYKEYATAYVLKE